MYTPETGLDLITKRIFASILNMLEEEQLLGWKATFSKTALWYYQSSLHLIPDIVPGFGYLDTFLLAQIALWLCSPNPDTIDQEMLASFDRRCQIFLIADKLSIPKLEK